MKRYFIVGSGLQGCLTALKLLKASVLAENITVVEKGDKLFPGWEYQSIAGNNVYLGFQGFELPRAQATLGMIIDLIGSLNGTFKSSKRYISINSETCVFNSDKSKWPSIFSDSLTHEMTNADFSPKDLKQYFSDYQSTPFFQLIKQCSARYSDNWLDTIRFFYPWFFPNEFLIKDKTDEGMSFLSDVRAGIISSAYFFPSNGFQALASNIISSLKLRGVKFELKCDGVNLIQQCKKTDSVIWTASSFPLLDYLSMEYKFKKQWIQSALFYTLSSLSASSCPDATEILTMDQDLPMMSRISFPSMQGTSLADDSQCLIQVEFFCPDSSPISEDTLHLTTSSIKKILDIDNIYYLGSTKPRPIYQFTSDFSELHDRFTRSMCDIPRLQIPLVYWGPINMAKVARAVENVVV